MLRQWPWARSASSLDEERAEECGEGEISDSIGLGGAILLISSGIPHWSSGCCSRDYQFTREPTSCRSCWRRVCAACLGERGVG